jgi:hypothetical protein
MVKTVDADVEYNLQVDDTEVDAPVANVPVKCTADDTEVVAHVANVPVQYMEVLPGH